MQEDVFEEGRRFIELAPHRDHDVHVVLCQVLDHARRVRVYFWIPLGSPPQVTPVCMRTGGEAERHTRKGQRNRGEHS